MKDILEIATHPKESVLLVKWVSETIKNEKNEQKGGFLCMLSGKLAASFLGNMIWK